jgi:hypothetical protein
MLQTSNYAKGDIVAFKMANGDELLAEYSHHTTTGHAVRRACVVVPSAQGIGLMQYLFTGNTDSQIELKDIHVMAHAESVPEIRAHYTKTTTGIDVAPHQGIIF